jgi:hypothetical protein
MRVLSEYIQNKSCTIEQLDVVSEDLLQFALVTGRELVVEQDDVSSGLLDLDTYFSSFAWADECSWVWVH